MRENEARRAMRARSREALAGIPPRRCVRERAWKVDAYMHERSNGRTDALVATTS